MINYQKILPNWKLFLSQEEEKPYFKILINTVLQEYKNYECFPKIQNIFVLFKMLAPEDIKVIILGQDPYHNFNQANGLCFSVNEKVALPPSLQNIFKELKNDLQIDHFYSGNLINWVKQGVFLYNTILTVRAHSPLSHKDIGWLTFTNNLLTYLNVNFPDIIYVLWGNYAKSFAHLLMNKSNLILGAHPSPFSYSLFKNKKFFLQINDLLKKNKKEYIDWEK